MGVDDGSIVETHLGAEKGGHCGADERVQSPADWTGSQQLACTTCGSVGAVTAVAIAELIRFRRVCFDRPWHTIRAHGQQNLSPMRMNNLPFHQIDPPPAINPNSGMLRPDADADEDDERGQPPHHAAPARAMTAADRQGLISVSTKRLIRALKAQTPFFTPESIDPTDCPQRCSRRRRARGTEPPRAILVTAAAETPTSASSFSCRSPPWRSSSCWSTSGNGAGIFMWMTDHGRPEPRAPLRWTPIPRPRACPSTAPTRHTTRPALCGRRRRQSTMQYRARSRPPDALAASCAWTGTPPSGSSRSFRHVRTAASATSASSLWGTAFQGWFSLKYMRAAFEGRERSDKAHTNHNKQTHIHIS